MLQLVDFTEEEITARNKNFMASDPEMVYGNNVITIYPSMHLKLTKKDKAEESIGLSFRNNGL